MCIVHRIVKDSKTGNTTAVRFELAPKKGITLSTRVLEGLSTTNVVEQTSETITFPNRRRESFMDRMRRIETGHLTGATVKSRPPEEYQLSPQVGGMMEPIRPPKPKGHAGAVRIVQVGHRMLFRPVEPVKSDSHGKWEHRHIHVKYLRRAKAAIKRQAY